MYNEKIKRAYIDSIELISQRIKAARFLEAIKQIETEAGMDLYEMSVSQLENSLKKMGNVKVGSARSQLMYARLYCKWCYLNHIDGATDSYKWLKSLNADLSAIREKTVGNPLGLKIYLDTVFSKESDMTSDNIIKAAFWLVYCGVLPNDIYTVKNSEIDMINLRIKLANGYFASIPPEAIPSIRNCLEAKSFRYEKNKYNNPVKRVDGDVLLRGMRTVGTIKTLFPVIGKRTRKAFTDGITDQNLTMSNVRDSGIYYRAYSAEIAGVTITEKILERFADGATDFSSGEGKSSEIRLVGYSNWKTAHYGASLK